MEFTIHEICEKFGREEVTKRAHHICSCALISHSAVITAKHCHEYKNPCSGNWFQLSTEDSGQFFTVTFPQDFEAGILGHRVQSLAYFTPEIEGKIDDIAMLFVSS